MSSITNTGGNFSIENWENIDPNIQGSLIHQSPGKSNKNIGIDFTRTLPHELLVKIISHVPSIADVEKISIVNKAWHAASTGQSVFAVFHKQIIQEIKTKTSFEALSQEYPIMRNSYFPTERDFVLRCVKLDGSLVLSFPNFHEDQGIISAACRQLGYNSFRDFAFASVKRNPFSILSLPTFQEDTNIIAAACESGNFKSLRDLVEHSVSNSSLPKPEFPSNAKSEKDIEMTSSKQPPKMKRPQQTRVRKFPPNNDGPQSKRHRELDFG